MSIASSYTHQTATWQQASGIDSHGQTTRTTTSIDARWEWKRRLVRNAEGKDIASNGLCITVSAITLDDILTAPDGRDYVVLTVSVIYGLDGSELYREAYV